MVGLPASVPSLLHMPHICVRRCRAAFIALCLTTPAMQAPALDISGPSGSVSFGTSVNVLPNGNIVVTDPDADSNAYSGVGAVYLYDPYGNPISKITGSQPDDHVGDGGIAVLANGNYVIASRHWRNGTAADAGAVTWASATSGASGVVSAGNSLVGSSAEDRVGGVTVLTNGNYVVSANSWDNGAIVDAGAVTWCNGNGGTVGAVSASNSLVGTSANDNVGWINTVVLSNGNYVTGTPYWDDGAVADVGAVTWGDGNGGTVGAVSAANSLIGSSAYDYVGYDVVALSNGNYVVGSSAWSNGATLYVGAATWANGNGGTVGAVSVDNSLVGDEENDGVGSLLFALSNGNYVATTSYWHGTMGAATWGNGSGGTVGAVSASNSLVGSAAGDRVGGGAIALSNGNYVVESEGWGGNLGAATWASADGGTVGEVTALNSLTGAATQDEIGATGLVALNNGNYAVSSAYFNGNSGAATWGFGNGGTTGTVSDTNSLVGSTAGDQVGFITALSNGNFVSVGVSWDDGANADVGAATWMDGAGGSVGAVSAANSLIGSSANDGVGSGGVVALSSGDYLVASPGWTNGALVAAGAVTWANGNGGSVGMVSVSNSLVGTSAGDNVGSNGVYALKNGSYVILSPQWTNGAIVGAGAITLRRGYDHLGATISAENSVRGGAENGGYAMTFDYDAGRDQLVVGRPAENLVTLFKADQLFRAGFD